MEQWCLTAAGVARAQDEKLTQHSDEYKQYICRCGKPAIVNVKKSLYKCSDCGDNADIAKIKNTWSSKLLFQELDSCNIGVKRYLEPYKYQTYKDDHEEKKED
jgi:DNA-directed RNA polymerase beta subunit